MRLAACEMNSRLRELVASFAQQLLALPVASPVSSVQSPLASRALRPVQASTLSEPGRQLHGIHALPATEAPLACQRRLEPGVRVRVNRGALARLEGVVLACSAGRVTIAAEFQEQEISVEVADPMVDTV